MANTSNQRLSEIGFAEFTSMLLSETLDAVISAQLSQEEKLREVEDAVNLSAAAYMERYITDEQLRAELFRLFPGESGTSCVAPGAPYTPADGTNPEAPPVLERCGYAVQKDDLAKNNEGLTFSATGVDRIATHIAVNLAVRQRGALATMAARGLPRVMVDHGRVSAKLTFSLVQQESSSAGPADLSNRGKLKVHPVNTRGPEFLSLKTDITGEVEVTFKTITD